MLPIRTPPSRWQLRGSWRGGMSGGGGTSGNTSLKSFPVPTVMEDEERDVVDEEIHKDEDVSIKASGIACCHVDRAALHGSRAIYFAPLTLLGPRSPITLQGVWPQLMT